MSEEELKKEIAELKTCIKSLTDTLNSLVEVVGLWYEEKYGPKPKACLFDNLEA